MILKVILKKKNNSNLPLRDHSNTKKYAFSEDKGETFKTHNTLNNIVYTDFETQIFGERVFSNIIASNPYNIDLCRNCIVNLPYSADGNILKNKFDSIPISSITRVFSYGERNFICIGIQDIELNLPEVTRNRLEEILMNRK